MVKYQVGSFIVSQADYEEFVTHCESMAQVKKIPPIAKNEQRCRIIIISLFTVLILFTGALNLIDNDDTPSPNPSRHSRIDPNKPGGPR